MGSTPNLPPDGGRSFFDNVETDLAGDVVLGNLEGTLSVGGGSKCGAGSTNCYAFQTPPSYAAWLKKAGFTVMNLANNHAYDYGPSGQAQTLAALQKQHLATTGRPGEIAYQQVGDIKVAILGFAPYKWAQSLTNIPAARRLVKKAAANADVVIVTMHAGAGGQRPHARAAGHRDVPRREPRQLERVHPRGRRRGGRPRDRQRAARPARHGVVPRPPDRLLARQLRRLQGLRPGWAAVDQRHPPRDASRQRRASTAARSSRREWSAAASRRSTRPRAAHGIVRTLSREDFGSPRGQGLGERRSDAARARSRSA